MRRAAEARDGGNAEETLSLLEQAYQVRPLPEVLNNIGRTLEDLGRYDEAADAYRRVIEHPNAKAALIDLDRQRLDMLAAKLGRGWLLVENGSLSAYLDGDPIAVAEEVEVPLGPHLLELSQDDAAILLFFTAIPSKRTAVVRTPAERLESDAFLDLTGANLEKLFINDRPIRSKLWQLSLAMPAGTYRIRVERADGAQSKQVRIGQGRRLMLNSVLQPPRQESITRAVTEPPSRSIVGPLVFGATGLVALGVGSYLMAIAEADRDRVRDPTIENGVVVMPTMIEAVALESRANDRATAGIVALSAAGALGIGALLWWLLDL
jgi:hypothetical protein